MSDDPKDAPNKPKIIPKKKARPAAPTPTPTPTPDPEYGGVVNLDADNYVDATRPARQADVWDNILRILGLR